MKTPVWTLFLIKCSIKKRLQHRFFPVNIAKFLKTPMLKNTCYWLLLYEDAKILEKSICFWVSECFCRIYLNRNILEYLAPPKWVFLIEKRVLHYVFNFQKQLFADVLQNRRSLKFRPNYLNRDYRAPSVAASEF